MTSNYKGAGGGSLFLPVLGNDLFGESHDIDTGGLSFRHVDVSLPGNSALPVEFSRSTFTTNTFNDGRYLTDNAIHIGTELGLNWEVGIPYVLVRGDTSFSGRCQDDSRSDRFEDGNVAVAIDSGRKLHRPGETAEFIGKAPSGSPRSYRSFGTKSYWTGSCLSGGGGYKFKDPKGNTYIFDHHVVRNGGKHILNVYSANPSTVTYVRNHYHRLTKVEDVSGNWVEYSYNTNGINGIESSDGRSISVSYSGRHISSVTANGRTWRYRYNTVPSQPDVKLREVELPDGRSWSISGIASARKLKTCEDGRFNRSVTTVIKHPGGATGKFKTSPRHNISKEVPAGAPNQAKAGRGPHEGATLCSTGTFVSRWFMTEALIEKTIELSDGTRYVWSYDYPTAAGKWERSCAARGQGGNSAPCLADTGWYYFSERGEDLPNDKVRIVTAPDGGVTKYYINRRFNDRMGTTSKVERYASASSTTPLEIKTYNTYQKWEDRAGAISNVSMLPAPSLNGYRIKPSETTLERDGDTYTTENTYSTDPTDSLYSFGQPTRTKKVSSVSDDDITMDTTHRRINSKWVLGLTATVTVNDTETSRYIYDASGRRLTTYIFDKFAQRLYYRTDGTVSQVRDALARYTDLDEWKRGRPTKVTYHDDTTISFDVDDNGWVTGTTDQMGAKTTFQHDSMGRLTRITPPQGQQTWSRTDIAYDFANDPVQTITRGSSRITVNYDSMQRPVLETTEATDTLWVSHVNTRYDAFGRVVFKSQPSTSATEIAGVETAYDTLGRVTKERETVAPFAETTHSYLSSNRHRVTDALGNITDTYRYGWDGPGVGPSRAIYRYGGQAGTEITETYRDAFGRLTLARRVSNDDQSGLFQRYYYDEHGRMCRSSNHEAGSTFYAHNNAGEVTSYSKGHRHPDSAGCDNTTPTGTTKVTLTRDKMGRVTRKNFADAGTPDITNTYDAKGRLTKVVRGDTRREFTYNDMDQVLQDRAFAGSPWNWRLYQDTTYDALGHVKTVNAVSGRVYDYTTDSLGRTLSVIGRDTGAQAEQIIIEGTTFHPDGSVKSLTYGNGHIRTRTLDDRQQTKRITVSRSGSTVMDLDYTYTDRGQVHNIMDRVNPKQSHAYGYDGLGQLTSVFTGENGVRSVLGNGSYSYDVRGNLTRKVMNRRVLTYTYNARNQLARIDSTRDSEGDYVLDYDTRGNVTRFGDLRLTYDASDQPVRITGGKLDVDYKYDGLMKRIMVINVPGRDKINHFALDGSLAGIYESGRSYTDHIRANGKLVATLERNGDFAEAKWTPSFRHNDHLGSTQVATGADGLVRFQEYYTPYGEVISPSLSNDDYTGYTGHIRDAATGLTYMQARYYSPIAGRMLSVDPVDFASDGRPGMVNRYSYAFNDPINMWDPDGRCTMAYGSYSATCPMRAAYEANPRQFVTDTLNVVGWAIVVFDVATIPSGEGAAGAMMLRTAAKRAGEDIAVGAATNAAIDVGIQMSADGKNLSDLDLGRTLQSTQEGAVGGLMGGSVGRQGNRVGSSASKSTGKWETEPFESAVEDLAGFAADNAGTLGATGGGIVSAVNQSQERSCASGFESSC